MRITYRDTLTRPQPMDYGAVRTLCAALRGRYPLYLRPFTAGASLLGRELTGLVLRLPDGTAAPMRVLVAAAFHGQEWLTALCALRLCEDLCGGLSRGMPLCGLPLPEALRGRQIWFLPMVNPDGVEIARRGSRAAGKYANFSAAAGADTPGLWQANARGVDINHNFNAGWDEMQAQATILGKNRPGPRQYSGETPESEPETRAVTDLCRRCNFRHVVALHSQGEEIYWRYGEHTPPQSRIMAQVLGSVSGYRVADPEGFASHGGFKDWFIRCYRRPGFTLELGRGQNPLPVEDFESVYTKAREMLMLTALL